MASWALLAATEDGRQSRCDWEKTVLVDTCHKGIVSSLAMAQLHRFVDLLILKPSCMAPCVLITFALVMISVTVSKVLSSTLRECSAATSLSSRIRGR